MRRSGRPTLNDRRRIPFRTDEPRHIHLQPRSLVADQGSYTRGASPSRSPAEGSYMRGAGPSRSPAEGSSMRGARPSRSPAEGSSMRGARPSRSPAEGSSMRGAGPSRSPAEGSRSSGHRVREHDGVGANGMRGGPGGPSRTVREGDGLHDHRRCRRPTCLHQRRATRGSTGFAAEAADRSAGARAATR